MIDYQSFLNHFDAPELAVWREQLPEQISQGLNTERYGDLPRWLQVLNGLPDIEVDKVDLNQAAIQVSAKTPLAQAQIDELRAQLKGLHPWRKGPFDLLGVYIDTEWRSDWKWQRVIDHISPLAGRKVLDIGCGSGYHCWRMRGAGADWVLGIEPSPLFIVQFFALQKYIQDSQVGILPIGIEKIPPKLQYFDTVFSMGVFYHRRSPFDHLLELRDTLRPGGELVLETLVIDGARGQVLVPGDRYGKMGNVWFIPSTATLEIWLQKVGFTDIRVANVSNTTVDEQRSTEWMTFHSLAQFLNPENPDQTIEGYPAPKRAILVATAPGGGA